MRVSTLNLVKSADIFAGFLIFAIASVVISKHRRPNLSDAANRRRELERQRQLDSSRALMGYTGYAPVGLGDVDPKELPPSPPPQDPSTIPTIKVYPASERSLRRASMTSIASQSDIEGYHQESYEDSSGEDQKSILSHAAHPGESVHGDHDIRPPVSAFFVTLLGLTHTDP